MNSLEFINEEIKRYKTVIRIVSGERKSYYKKVVKQLQQIKSELEAWYVLKPDLEHTENALGEHEIKFRKFYTDADVELHDTKEKYYKLKKALEVEDE